MHIIDSHCHIYPDAIAERASAAIGTFYDIPIDADGRVSTLLEASALAGISHHVVCSVATTPHQVASINRFLSESVKMHPDRLTGLGALHQDSDDMEADIEQAVSLGLRGFKIHPDVQQVAVDDERLMNAYALIQGKLPVLMHLGDHRYDYSNPGRVRRVLDRFPDLTVIGAHFGGWSVWEEAARELHDYPNLYVDTSSSLFALTPEQATELVHLYGSERVLFGVDYPMWTPAEELARFDALALTDEERERILWRNAAALFDIAL